MWRWPIAVLAILAAVASADEPTRSVTIDDLLAQRTLHPRSPLAISRDGGLMAVTVIHAEHDEAVDADTQRTAENVMAENIGSRIVIVPTAGGATIDPWGEDATCHSPVFSPDGRRLACYLRQGRQPMSLAVWDRDSGRVQTYPQAAVGARIAWQLPRWTPDGSAIVFPHELPDPRRPATGPSVKVLRHDPSGTLWPEAKTEDESVGGHALVKLDLASGQLTVIAPAITAGCWRISPDGKAVAWTQLAGRDAAGYRGLFDVMAAPLDGSAAPRRIGGGFAGFFDPAFSFSPGGRWIAVGDERDIVCLDVAGQREPVRLRPPDSTTIAAAHAPMWAPDDSAVFVSGTRGGIVRLPLEGAPIQLELGLNKPQLLVTGKYTEAPTVDADGRFWAITEGEAVLVDPAGPRIVTRWPIKQAGRSAMARFERIAAAGAPVVAMKGGSSVWLLDLATGTETRIFDLPTLEIPRRIQQVTWTPPSGQPRQDPILLPPDYRPGMRVPVMIEVYAGGGGRVHGLVIAPELLAAAGYAVFFPKIDLPRGEPLKDIAAAVTAAADGLAQSPYADKDRIGLMGQSYGCYSVLCTLVTTDRFRTAITCNGLSNLVDMYAYGWSAYVVKGQGRLDETLYQNRDKYIANSPLFFLDRVRTPILILAGESDTFSTRHQRGVYTMLKDLNRVAVEYRAYPGETHAPRAWTAKHQRDMTAAVIDWLERTMGR